MKFIYKYNTHPELDYPYQDEPNEISIEIDLPDLAKYKVLFDTNKEIEQLQIDLGTDIEWVNEYTEFKQYKSSRVVISMYAIEFRIYSDYNSNDILVFHPEKLI